MGAFYDCSGLYGSLHLPESLKGIGSSAFHNCRGLTGSLSIPQSISVIHEESFNDCGFNGTLKLHNGITTIGERAFSGNHFKGEQILPSELEVISVGCFNKCEFSGKLVLPRTLRVIGSLAFAWNRRLTGMLEIPGDVISIGAGAFANCTGLEGVIFPEGLETIRYDGALGGGEYGAFTECYGINSIVCKGTEPPVVQNGAFDGVPKDNFTVEVPENAIVRYQTAPGWKNFKRISAYRNLSVSPNVATAINVCYPQTVSLKFSHRMSRLVVNLVKGEDFEGDFPEDIRVKIHGVVTDAVIDLGAGIVTADSRASKSSVTARKEAEGRYAAIMIPQNISRRQPFVEILTDNVSYLLEGRLDFKSGVEHHLNVTLTSDPSKVKIDIGGEVPGWN